jgi:hypothetical protein
VGRLTQRIKRGKFLPIYQKQMSEDIDMRKYEQLPEELNETNIGFRFLYNQDQTENSALLFIQWCLAPQVTELLCKEEVRGGDKPHRP